MQTYHWLNNKMIYIFLLLFFTAEIYSKDIYQPNPIQETASLNKNINYNNWEYNFKSSDQLLESTRQSIFTKITYGSTNNIYYAIYKQNQHLLFVAVPSSGGQFSASAIEIESDNHQPLKFESTLIPFIVTTIQGSSPQGVTININGHFYNKNTSLMGYALKILNNKINYIYINFVGVLNNGKSTSFKVKVPLNNNETEKAALL